MEHISKDFEFLFKHFIPKSRGNLVRKDATVQPQKTFHFTFLGEEDKYWLSGLSEELI